MSHDSHADEKKAAGGSKNYYVDNFFSRVADYIGEGIAKLVAFLLIIITIGAVFGYFVAQKQGSFLLLFIPAALGIIAYYERDIAILIFVGIVLFIIL